MNTPTEDLSPYFSELPTPVDQPLPTKPSALRYVFLGADGLRAGWSIFIFVALVFGLLRGVSALNHIVHLLPKSPVGSADATPAFMYAFECLVFFTALLVTWIMSKIEKRSIAVYGLGGERKLSRFLTGMAWGVTFLSLLVLTLWKTGLLVIESRELFGGNILRYGAVWLGGFLFVALAEEYLVRGYLQYTLTRGLTGLYKWAFKTRHSATLGFWTAAFIFSFLFGFGHQTNPGESPIGLLAAGLAALVFCLSLWRTGSLWWAVGFHTAWDWAQSFLYGVADSGNMVKFHLLATHAVGKPLLSGGATGPEGSIFILPVLTAITLIVLFTLPRVTPRDDISETSAQFQTLQAN